MNIKQNNNKVVISGNVRTQNRRRFLKKSSASLGAVSLSAVAPQIALASGSGSGGVSVTFNPGTVTIPRGQSKKLPYTVSPPSAANTIQMSSDTFANSGYSNNFTVTHHLSSKEIEIKNDIQVSDAPRQLTVDSSLLTIGFTSSGQSAGTGSGTFCGTGLWGDIKSKMKDQFSDWWDNAPGAIVDQMLDDVEDDLGGSLDSSVKQSAKSLLEQELKDHLDLWDPAPDLGGINTDEINENAEINWEWELTLLETIEISGDDQNLINEPNLSSSGIKDLASGDEPDAASFKFSTGGPAKVPLFDFEGTWEADLGLNLEGLSDEVEWEFMLKLKFKW